MSDTLKELDSLVKKSPVKKETASPKEIISGSADYKVLEKVMKSEALYAVKNTLERDLVIDWDSDLMPEDLKDSFNKYLNDKYVQYQLDRITDEVILVAVKVNGRTINFLHNFMTDKQIPTLARVYEAGEAMIKSQFVIPAGQTVICTATQVGSLDRYRKYKIDSEQGESDWTGFLAIKELNKSNLKKVKYSMVTTSDIKAAGFDVEPEEVAPVKKKVTRTIEPDDLSDL